MLLPQYIIVEGEKRFFTTQAALERHDPRWRTADPGMPEHFILWGSGALRPYPLADREYAVTLWGVPYPPAEISADNLLSDFPPLLVDCLVYRATAELLEHTHPTVADAYASEAEEYLNKFKIQLRKRQSHNISVLAPSTPLQVRQYGEISGVPGGGSRGHAIWNRSTQTWNSESRSWEEI
jgi:hypothetical protein